MRRPPDTAWDFGPVIELLETDWSGRSPHTPLSSPRRDKQNPKSTPNEVKLGSFDKIFESMGIPLRDPKTPSTVLEPVTEDSCTSDDAVYSPPGDSDDKLKLKDTSDDGKAFSADPFVKGNATSDAEDPFSGMTKKQRHRARKQADKARKSELTKHKESEKEKGNEHTQTPLDQALQIKEKGNATLKQVAARSNVGAKIRPATPVLSTPSKNDADAEASAPSLMEPRLDMPFSAQPKDMISGRTNSYQNHHIHLPVCPPNFIDHNAGSVHPASIQNFGGPLTPNSLSMVSNLNTSLSTQYATNAAAIPYHCQLPNGFLTPSRGPLSNTNLHWTNPSIAPHVPQITTASEAIRPSSTSKLSKRLVHRSREDRDFDFLKQLIDTFPEDKKWLVSPMRLSNDSLSPTGIHVFVDASNILIGFKEVMKRNGGSARDMSFDCLALLLERRRPVAKRVYAGSTRLNAPIASVEKFNELAGAVGYEKNIYEQVYKAKEQTESQKFFKDVDRMGWAKATQRRSGSGSGSDSETGAVPSTPPPALKWVEQGVDESLHLKMCQSIIDAEAPSTMVLATGDGAVAEYSDGFLAHVERALKKGWKVELVSWRQQTSSGYKNRKFRQKWGDQFKIIELDEFLNSMADS